ncbi:4-(cytidine 5'-diphospho)-2-C-methyl-D-erythritol kinase [Puniceibacterium sediminis]|uniref:4-diphosphocytidyl-2-C-methyl-D-erythritol kinase n=1 Tax=Puniceibacterium sediminis TaxID=1608407 RepID=A0A238VJR9_9RHOB|nr:4-(cytidine 5'-diphospho)-2-C-methyl-D-erythritol kinase [Puniceibacterium sediminis]SNR34615.1 4-diphosphocytidyl-2-C-methyl-D-erythritol kinase [Puniceibacterium sediminis]
MATEAFAPAKINLTLHVTGQRADGYHLLDSLVVFADIGDTVRAEAAGDLSLTVDGPMAAGVPTDGSNLVLRAARFLASGRGARITLTKRLPASSGIGGGSSDAAAALRALSFLWGVPVPQDVLALGADVPVCLCPVPQRLQGVGEVLTPVEGLPECEVVLVNPGVGLSTPQVFRALRNRDNPAMAAELPAWGSAQALADWLKGQRNDLTAAATSVQPEIATVLGALSDAGALFHGMSGSGATCFALFAPGTGAAEAARKALSAAQPLWWVASGKLLGEGAGKV